MQLFQSVFKVWISVEPSEVVVCSTCSAAVQIAADKIQKFLHNNQKLQFIFTYPASVVSKLFCHKKLETIVASWLEHWVSVNKRGDTEIEVQGTPFGVFKVARKIADLSEEENRFEDDDEEERFVEV